HLTSVKDPKGLTTTYAWDALDNNTSVTSPDTGKSTRTFDAAGNVPTSTDARGKVTTYAYDALNRKISETRAGGPNVQFQYDQGTNGTGRLTKITDGTGSTAYSYDANGRIIQKLQTIGTLSWKTSYAYDAGGRVASVTYPSGTIITYGYDAAGRAVSAKAGAQNLFTGATYAPFGGVTGWVQGNGAAYARTIDQNNRVSGFSVPGRSVTLTYNAGDRITATAVNAAAAKTYGYDALARLTSFSAGTTGQTYTYDADGNRLTAALKNGTTTNNFTYAFPSTSNRLTSVGGAATETFTYDASGNTLTDAPSYVFTYDDRGRLVSSKIGAIIKTYGVNGLGQRVSKRDAATPSTDTYFVYDEAGHLIGEYNSSGARIEETVWLGDLPVATIQASGFFFIAPDHLGAPYQITNAAKAQVWLWDHDPFGADAPTGSLVYSLRFPGQYYDSETRLNYNYYRDYSPKLGRYIESDPIGLGGGINTYTYAESDPVSKADPLGLDVYACTQPLHGLGEFYGRLFYDPDSNPLFHQYLTVQRPWSGPGSKGGQDRSGNPFWSRGKKSEGDGASSGVCRRIVKDKVCMDDCVEEAINGSRPQYSLIGGRFLGGQNCQDWASDVIKKCQASCR
ncbi:MAG: RHS repeat protein, partial [Hyphomicrobiales bacterium]